MGSNPAACHWVEGFAANVLLAFNLSGAERVRGAACAQVLGLAGNVLSRRFEFQADAFAVSLGRSEPLKGALHKLDVKNRSAVNVDAWCAHQPSFGNTGWHRAPDAMHAALHARVLHG